MAIVSPVRGFLPSRAGRSSLVVKVPNPAMVRASPPARASPMLRNTTLTAEAASAFESDGPGATFAMISVRFMSAAPIACGDGWSTRRRGLSSRSRWFGDPLRDRAPVGRRCIVMPDSAETLTLTLSSPSNGNTLDADDGSATGTMWNSVATVLSVADAQTSEGDCSLVFEVTLNKTAGSEVGAMGLHRSRHTGLLPADSPSREGFLPGE